VGKRDPAQKGFVPEFKRWVVERTFGLLLHERRLSKDYEQWPEIKTICHSQLSPFLIHCI
jgi:transposase